MGVAPEFGPCQGMGYSGKKAPLPVPLAFLVVSNLGNHASMCERKAQTTDRNLLSSAAFSLNPVPEGKYCHIHVLSHQSSFVGSLGNMFILIKVNFVCSYYKEITLRMYHK